VGIAVGFKRRSTEVKKPVSGDLKTVMLMKIIIIISPKAVTASV